MIKPMSTIVLRPFKRYKDAPEKDVDFLERMGEHGRMLYFQSLDFNRDPITKKCTSGFYNVCILTNQTLAVGDRVTVKSIVGVKMFRMKRLVIVTILDKDEQRIYSEAVEGFEFGEGDF